MIERTAAMEMASRLGTMAAELMEDALGEGTLRPAANPAATLPTFRACKRPEEISA